MSDQNQNAPEMPEPTPVFDVTYSHIYMGQVHNQFYFFLWISLAFFVGAVLPWNGTFSDGGYTIWQFVMIIASAGAFWASMASIKSRRLTLWPILTLEIHAILFVLVHFRDVQANSSYLELRHKAAIQAEMDAMPNLQGEAQSDYRRILSERMEFVGDVFPLKMGNVFGAPVQGLILANDFDNEPGDPPTRFMASTAWHSFGMGFHMTWLSMIALTGFMVISFVSAFKNAKPKEDPKEARRRAREARESGSDKNGNKDDVEKQSEASAD